MEILTEANEFNLKCPFCGGKVRIRICDDEGNIKSYDYTNDPWSGLRYQLVHTKSDIPEGSFCPIATSTDDMLGSFIYDSREEAFKAWQGNINSIHNKNDMAE